MVLRGHIGFAHLSEQQSAPQSVRDMTSTRPGRVLIAWPHGGCRNTYRRRAHSVERPHNDRNRVLTIENHSVNVPRTNSSTVSKHQRVKNSPYSHYDRTGRLAWHAHVHLPGSDSGR
eukprot:scaffold225_cov388-Prasinococcus_capsulatus_cf.AAC.5